MKNKILWVLITLVLGALGSGLWELAFRPILSLLATGALDIVTLGLDSLRNSLYEEAARGQYERVSITVLSAVAGIMSGVTASVLVLPILMRRINADRKNDSSARRFTTVLILVFVTTIALLLCQRVIYINRATNHFEQLAQIASPYQSEAERLLIRSQFAQVTTREQYTKVVGLLSVVALSNKARIPGFTIY